MDVDELIIPVRFEGNGAVGDLKKVEAAGAAAGDAAAQGMHKAGGAAKDYGAELTVLMRVQSGLAVGKEILSAITEQLHRASEHTKQTAQDFIALRRSMQEVATLSGKANNNEFTVEQAKQAKAAHLNPEEWRDFQAEFLNYAGSQVGGPNGKLTEEQGQDYASRVAELMKGSGINPQQGAELAGSLLEQSQGPQDVDELMKKFSRTFTVLEKGRVPLKKALPEISQIMSMGVSAEDAAKMYSIVSPAAAGEEGTSVRAALKAVQEMQNKGTGEEFGVTRDMTKYEAVQAFAGNIEQRRQGFKAQGMTDTRADNEVQAMLMDRQVAADSREARGLVAGFGRMGAGLGGFKRYEAIEAETPVDFEARRKARYEDSHAGKQAARDADEALAMAERGQRNAITEEIRQEARTQLTREGRFEQITPGDFFRGINLKTSVDDQLVNERATEIARERFGRAPDDRRLTDFGAGNSETNEKILKAIEYQNRLMEQEAKRGAAPPPAAPAAPPPRPANRPLVIPAPAPGGGRRQ